MTNGEHLDYEQLLRKHPWIGSSDLPCILSPDSDGMLCGLVLTNLLNWRVAGFYDGKVLVKESGLDPAASVFVDIEINRPGVRSVGHHVVVLNNRILPKVPNFNFDQCIQPNNIRGIDGRSGFQRKYPFGTIHLLISILYHAGLLARVPHEATTVLLFTDGVWNNLFGYTENCLDWFNYLRMNEPDHPLYHILHHPTSIHDVMAEMDRFLRVRDTCNAKGVYSGGVYRTGGRNRRTGDKLRISDARGRPINIAGEAPGCVIHAAERERIERFLRALTDRTGWGYDPGRWCWEGLDVRTMEKGTTKPTNGRYMELFELNPLSLAMTSSDLIEYTLEA